MGHGWEGVEKNVCIKKRKAMSGVTFQKQINSSHRYCKRIPRQQTCPNTGNNALCNSF